MKIKQLPRQLVGSFIRKLAALMEEPLPKFGNKPTNLTIQQPRTICNPEHIFFGDDVWLGRGSLLIAITRYPGSSMVHPFIQQEVQHFTPTISVGSRVTATAGLQIAAMGEVTVEDDVMFASNINITDGLHGYESAYEPYKYQKMFRIAPIRVKRGCWIGQNVVILPGVTIGELSIVGANSVVTKSIPDRCIAAGSPARVIKRWDENSHQWISQNT
jgi:acetyltransferase-like isoleucine patch superfamily enzyme